MQNHVSWQAELYLSPLAAVLQCSACFPLKSEEGVILSVVKEEKNNDITRNTNKTNWLFTALDLVPIVDSMDPFKRTGSFVNFTSLK